MNYSDQFQFEMLLIFFIFTFPNLKYLPKLLFTNQNTVSYWSFKSLQYTNWNMLIILTNFILNMFNINNILLYEFITINSISICIIFHLIYIYDHNLIFIFPKTNNMSFSEFHMYSFLVHILPVIYFVYNYKLDYISNNANMITNNTNNTNNIIIYNMGIYTSFFKLLWCLNVFKSFNIAELYYDKLSHKSIITVKVSILIQVLLGLYISMLKNNLLNNIKNNDT